VKPVAMLIAILGVLALSSGCATSRSVSLPGSSGMSEFGEDQTAIKPGDNLEVQLVTGEVWRGEVVSASQSELVLWNANGQSAVHDTVSVDAISSMAIVGEGFGFRDALVTVLVAVVAAGATFAISMSSYSLF